MKQLLFITILSFFITACSNHNSKILIAVSDAVSVDNNSGSCPYITRDNRNNIVLSWIKQVDTATPVVCYAVSQDDGKTFGNIIEIPGSTNVQPHGENVPKVIFKSSGEIIAAWGAANPNPKNKYAGLVYYSQSFNEGKTWTKPRCLTDDTASFDQRYFDMALLPNGEAAIVWLDNRKLWKNEGSGLYYAATKDNDGFRDEKLIGGPCCQCCRTDLFIDRNKNIHVLYRAILNDSIRDMVHIVSSDRGKSFTEPKRISQDNWVIHGCPHTGPSMTENKEGLHFTWFTGGSGCGIYYNSKFFTARDSVSGKSSKHCQVTSLPNDNILIAWDESSVHGNGVSSRIAIEYRNADRGRALKEYITRVNSHSSFPVLCSINENKAVVAYTENIKGKNFIMVKQMSFD